MSASSGVIRVLHVDDEPDFAGMAAKFIQRHDERFAVDTATSASDGLERLAQNEYDCIVSDYEMPEADGIEFLESVRGRYPDLPFILYTGKGSEEVASEAISAGVTDYLQKGTGSSQYEVLGNRILNAVGSFQTERALEATRQRYEKLVEQNLAGIYIIQDEEFVYVNPKLAENHGYEPDEVIGMTPMELTAPEDRDRVREYVRKRLEGEVEAIDYETVGLTKEGERIHIELHGSRIEYQGEPAVIGVEIDITERKEREHELETVIERMTHALDATDSIIFENDLDNEILTRHGPFERLFGFDTDEISSTEEFYEKCVHPEDRARLREVRSEFSSAEDNRFSVEFRTHPDHGELRWINLDGYIRTGPDGRPSRIIGLDTDITARKERERELHAQRNELRVYQQAVEGSNDLLAGIDTEYNYLFANEPYRAYHGLSKDEVAGKTVPEVLDAEWESEVKPRVDRVLEGEQVRYEMERTDAHGNIRRFEIQYFPLRNESGSVEGVVGGMRDITERTERDQSLQREQERFRTLFENMNDAAALVEYVQDRPVIRDANPAFTDLFEPANESVEGRPLDEVVAAEHRRAEANELSQQVRSGTELSAEITRDTVNGPRTFRWEAVPLEDPAEGAIHHVIAVYSDISDLRDRERDLETVSERMIHALDVTDSIIYQIDLEDGTETRHGPFERVFGIPSEELPTTEDFYESCVHPEDREHMEQLQLDRIKDSGDRIAFEFRTHPERGPPRWIHTELYVRPGPDGDPRYLIGLDTDITERKEREHELRRIKEEFQTVFENVEDSLFMADVAGDPDAPEFRIRRLNPANKRLIGLSQEDVQGQTPIEIFGEDIGSTITANYQRCYETGEPISYEEQLDLPEGTRSFETTLTPVEIDGEIQRIVGTSHDITERIERERELQRQNERLDKFAHVLSHDLRNPLRVAEGNLELAMEECDAEPLEALDDALDRMDTLIEDTLTLSQAGRTIGATDRIGLSDIIESCWRNVDTASATLNAETDRVIEADETRLQQLLENLLRNAVDHGGADVTVRVGDLADGFYVEDDGPGIPADAGDKVFDAGYTLGETGTGLGLSIVQEITEAHDWRLDVTESEAGGARFEITGVDVADG